MLAGMRCIICANAESIFGQPLDDGTPGRLVTSLPASVKASVTYPDTVTR